MAKKSVGDPLAHELAETGEVRLRDQEFEAVVLIRSFEASGGLYQGIASAMPIRCDSKAPLQGLRRVSRTT